MLNTKKDTLTNWVKPIASLFNKVNPNTVTVLSLVFCIGSGLFFAMRLQIIAGILLLIGGFFDVLDGAVARENNRVTDFGGVLDSVSDRYADSAVFIGIMWGGGLAIPGYIENEWIIGAVALVGSLLVSYTRARAEAAGTGKLNIGLAERAERMLLIIVGAFLGILNWVVLIVALISHLTVLHRMIVTRRILRLK
ncbi:MAG TPA: CDP-alcohol phosphatidyltransferase family protein [Candidatus Nanoarchaeia archaeon]|nr:CDP-alcohol phosphatidyltransferase family protein [Candidatus Nanoarchaeia archaeon]